MTIFHLIIIIFNLIIKTLIRATFRPTGAFNCYRYHLTIPELKNNGKSIIDVLEL